MNYRSFPCRLFFVLFAPLIFLLCGCLGPAKVDKYVAGQFNYAIPKIDKRKNPDITIRFGNTSNSEDISNTVRKTSHVLPLIFYWQYDYRFTCSLNPLIAVNSFSNFIHVQGNKELAQKLNGRKLELTVEQVPNTFAIVDKGHIVWLILYVAHWDRMYVAPDFKDLIVSYKVSQNDTTQKSGRITIKNTEENKNLRWLQSWKSATSEYLGTYRADLTNMSKAFVHQLTRELEE